MAGENKPLVIIPAFNEARFIGPLVGRVVSLGLDVLVVDDGSTDETGRFAREAGASVVRHREKSGKGAALKTGCRFALEKGYSTVVTMDGDGQHDPRDISVLLERLGRGDAAMVIGRREFSLSSMPLDRFLTNIFTSRMVSLLCGQRLFDTQCGFRALRARVIHAFSFSTSHFDTESEMLVEARRAGFRIAEAPVRTIYGEEKSKQQPFLGTVRFFRFWFRHFRLLAMRRGRCRPGKKLT